MVEQVVLDRGLLCLICECTKQSVAMTFVFDLELQSATIASVPELRLVTLEIAEWKDSASVSSIGSCIVVIVSLTPLINRNVVHPYTVGGEPERGANETGLEAGLVFSSAGL